MRSLRRICVLMAKQMDSHLVIWIYDLASPKMGIDRMRFDFSHFFRVKRCVSLDAPVIELISKNALP
jgi:hypothetical protein